jgi:hypothetical protein
MPIALPSTATDPLTQSVQQLFNTINVEFNRLTYLLSTGAQLIWANPQGFTPQQVVANMSTNAAAVFEMSALLCPVLGAIIGTTPNPVPAGWSVTINGDGTVTLAQVSTQGV